MVIETYIDRRVRPLGDYLEKRAPVMAMRGSLLEATTLIANASGVILAVLGYVDTQTAKWILRFRARPPHPGRCSPTRGSPDCTLLTPRLAPTPSLRSYADWIALTVAIASAAMALMDYFYIPSQLAATNRALEETHNLLSWWDSLSLVQRKSRPSKLRCVMTCEGAVLALCQARTGASSALPGQQEQSEEE